MVTCIESSSFGKRNPVSRGVGWTDKCTEPGADDAFICVSEVRGSALHHTTPPWRRICERIGLRRGRVVWSQAYAKLRTAKSRAIHAEEAIHSSCRSPSPASSPSTIISSPGSPDELSQQQDSSFKEKLRHWKEQWAVQMEADRRAARMRGDMATRAAAVSRADVSLADAVHSKEALAPETVQVRLRHPALKNSRTRCSHVI